MKKAFTLRFLLTYLAALLGVASSFGQITSITTGAVTPSPVCVGSNVSVAFTAVGTMPPSSTYKAQLSDAAGGFTTPVEVGTGAASPITATIPVGTAAGAGYKVRVILVMTAAPTVAVVTGSSSSAITVVALPGVPTVTTPVNYNVGATALDLTASGTGLKWYDVALAGVALPGAPTPSTLASAIGTKSYYVSQTISACEGPRAKIDVIVTCATPLPTVTTPINYNVGASAIPLVATGTAQQWYDVASGGSALPGAPTPSTLAAAIGTKSYWVTQTLNGCEGPRAKIDVIVTCATAAPTGTTPVNYYTGVTATALAATGTALKWYDVALNGTALPGAPTPATTAVGTTSYYVSQTLNGCEGPRLKIDVVVAACPTVAPTATTSVNYNVGAVATPLAATGTALKWYDVSTGGSALPGAPTPSTLAAAIGTKSYWVSQTLTGCEGPRAKIDVVVTCATVAPTVTTPINYNVGGTALVLTATGTALKWYDVATGGSALPGAPTPSTLASAIGTKSYWVSQTLNGCEGPRAQIDVIVTCATALPTVATPVNYSVGATATPLTATGTALKWYDVSTGGSALPGAPTPLTTTIGTKSYYVSQTLNGCEGPRATIDVIVGACATVAPTVTSPVAYKVGDIATALTATGTALKWYANASGGSPLGAAPTPSTTAAAIGTTSYYVSQTVGGCEGPRAQIVVNVTCATPAPSVTTPVTYIVGATASALTASGSGLKWYTAETGGGALPSAPVPATDISAVGTTSYYVSQTVNGCEGSRAKIDVVVNCALAAPTVTTPVNYCFGVTASALTATSAGTLKWYDVASGGTALGAAPVPSTATAGTKSYYVSQTVSGCESARAKIDVVVAQTAAPTITPVEYCKDVAASALTAPGAASPKWYTNSTGGTGASIAPVPSTGTVGTTTPYYVSQTNAISGCESARAPQSVTIKALPSAPSAQQVDYCKDVPASALIASGVTNPKWYNGSSDVVGSGTAPTPSTGTIGLSTYYVSETGSNGCESPRATVAVLVKPVPAAPGTTNLEYCQFIQSAPLTATPVANASLSWFGTNATGGTSSSIAPTPSTLTGGTFSYYVGQTLDGCVGSRAKIDVLIKTTPKPATTTYFEFCQGASANPLTATGTNLKWYREANATNFQTDPFIPFNEKVQDYYFYVTQTGSNGCESPKEEIKIHVKGLPSAELSGTTSIGFGETVNIKITFGGDGPWNYKLSDGTGGTTTSASLNVAVKPSATTTYFITEVSNGCGKGVPLGTAVVTVRIPTISTGNPTIAEVCAGKTMMVPFQQSGSFPADFTFKMQISLSNTDASFKTIPSTATSSQVTATIPDTTRGGSYFLRIISSNVAGDQLVKGSVAGIGVTVNPLPSVTISGSKTILIGESADVRIDLIGKAPWTFKLNDGVKDSSYTVTLTPFSIVVKPKATTTYTINSIVNVCGNVAKGIGSARIQVDPILGLEPVVNNFARVYPTLVEAKCVVELDEPVSPKASEVELINLSGKTLMSRPIKEKITEVDFSSVPGGLYLLKVVNGTHTSVHRVVKQ